MKSNGWGFGCALLLLLLALSCFLGGVKAARPIKTQGHHHQHRHHHHEGRKDGSLYVVGDKDGWTDEGVDYDRWSWTKDFHAGDMIVFNYDKEKFKVFEVTMEDYRRCNAFNPINIFDSGHDSLTVIEKSHRFFIGEKQNCLAGQKVNIRVPEDTHHGERTQRSISTASQVSPSPSPNPSTYQSPISSSPWSSPPASPNPRTYQSPISSSPWSSPPAIPPSASASSIALPYVGRTLAVAGIAVILLLAA